MVAAKVCKGRSRTATVKKRSLKKASPKASPKASKSEMKATPKTQHQVGSGVSRRAATKASSKTFNGKLAKVEGVDQNGNEVHFQLGYKAKKPSKARIILQINVIDKLSGDHCKEVVMALDWLPDFKTIFTAALVHSGFRLKTKAMKIIMAMKAMKAMAMQDSKQEERKIVPTVMVPGAIAQVVEKTTKLVLQQLYKYPPAMRPGQILSRQDLKARTRKPKATPAKR